MTPREAACEDRFVIPNNSGEKLQFDQEVVFTDDGPFETLWLKQNEVKKGTENTTLQNLVAGSENMRSDMTSGLKFSSKVKNYEV